MDRVCVGRLAPSPTGALHVGNARTFLWAWLSVRSQGGRLLLRNEDLERPAQGTVLGELLSDLRWLGLTWDEGPRWGEADEAALAAGTWGAQGLAESGPAGPYTQSARGERYRAVFERWRAEGRIYPCVCRRSDYAAAAAGAAPHEGEFEARYPGTCARRWGALAPDEAETAAGAALAAALGALPGGAGSGLSWRFRVPPGPVTFTDRLFGPQSFDPAREVGDFVVFKSPEQPSYQMAVALDDALMGVTEVVRGADLLSSTARQLLLLRALGAPEPQYGHVPLVVGPDGKRIAKRHGDSRLRHLRRLGVAPARLLALLARESGFAVPPAWEALSAPDFLQRLLPLWTWAGRPRDKWVLDPARRASLESL